MVALWAVQFYRNTRWGCADILDAHLVRVEKERLAEDLVRARDEAEGQDHDPRGERLRQAQDVVGKDPKAAEGGERAAGGSRRVRSGCRATGYPTGRV